MQATINQEVTALGLRTTAYSLASSYPHEYCLAQTPGAGEPLNNHQLITYIAAADEKPMLVPDFEGYPLEEVLQSLAQYDIQAKVTHERTPAKEHTCAACIVADQRPRAGSLISLKQLKQMQTQLHIK